jgi:hypothetical protein
MPARAFQAARYSNSRDHRLAQPWNSRNLARQPQDHSLEEVYLLRPLPIRSALASPSIQQLHRLLPHQPPTLSHHPPLHPLPNNNNNRLSPLLNNLSLLLPSRTLSSLPQLPSSNRRTLQLNQVPLRAATDVIKMLF